MSTTEQKPEQVDILKKIEFIKKIKRILPKEMQRLLKLRLLMERKEPDWIRMDEWRFWRIARKDSWRRPKGLDNKIRKEIKGYPPRVKVGYGKPKAVRGLHPTGFEIVIVYRPEDLDKVDPNKQAVVIARTVGLRKRIEIVKRAVEKNVKIINITKDIVEALQKQT